MIPTFPKKCSCGGIILDLEEWRELPRVGLMDDEEGGYLELRNHLPCGSTLSIPVGAEPEIAVCSDCGRVEVVHPVNGRSYCRVCAARVRAA